MYAEGERDDWIRVINILFGIHYRNIIREAYPGNAVKPEIGIQPYEEILNYKYMKHQGTQAWCYILFPLPKCCAWQFL